MEKMYTYAKFSIHPGKATQFRRLSQRAVDIVREREPGTLFYEWFMNADETECVAIDCYVDLDAVMAHVQNIGPIMRELMTISDRQLEIYGADPSERFGGRTTARNSDFYGSQFAGKF
jgi:quinol monooxygenase YgiN